MLTLRQQCAYLLAKVSEEGLYEVRDWLIACVDFYTCCEDWTSAKSAAFRTVLLAEVEALSEVPHDPDDFIPAERAEIRRRYAVAQGETLKWADLMKLNNFIDARAHDDGGETGGCGRAPSESEGERYA